MKKLVSMLLVLAMALSLVACAAPGTAAEAPEAPAAPTDGTVDVGIVFPTKDEPRWTQDEMTMMEIAKEYDFNVELLYSQNSSSVELANVEALLAKGIKVLIIAAVDTTAATAAVQAAKDDGVTVIAYDRFINDTDAVDYIASFDLSAVGAAQGQYLVDLAAKRGDTNVPLYLSMGAVSDENAFLIFDGAWEVLQPYIADGTFRIVNSSAAQAVQDKKDLTRDELAAIGAQITQDWDEAEARNKAESFLATAPDTDKGVIYVINPNGTCARVIYDTLIEDPAVTECFATGQDTEAASIQYVLDGKQAVDLLKDTATIARTSFDIAAAEMKGEHYACAKTYNNNVKEVPFAQVSFTVVDRANVVETIFDAGVYDRADFDFTAYDAWVASQS